MEISREQVEKYMADILKAEISLRTGKIDDCSIQMCLIYESLSAHLKRNEL